MYKFGKVGFTTSVFALVVTHVACGDDDFTGVRNTDAFAEESFTYEVALAQRVRFELAGINGRVEVVGVPDRESITIEGTRRVESESVADATANLDRLRVVVAERSNYVRVHTDQPNNSGGRNFVVDYRVTLPSDLDVETDNINGQITLEDLASDSDVQNVNGQVQLVGLLGNTTAGVVNGEIEAWLTLPENGLADLATVNGSIELHLPLNTSATLGASLTNGTITVSGLSLSDVVQTPRAFTGVLGAGSATVELSTVNGSIHVSGS